MDFRHNSAPDFYVKVALINAVIMHHTEGCLFSSKCKTRKSALGY
jgi:hypothetical protein